MKSRNVWLLADLREKTERRTSSTLAIQSCNCNCKSSYSFCCSNQKLFFPIPCCFLETQMELVWFFLQISIFLISKSVILIKKYLNSPKTPQKKRISNISFSFQTKLLQNQIITTIIPKNFIFSYYVSTHFFSSGTFSFHWSWQGIYSYKKLLAQKLHMRKKVGASINFLCDKFYEKVGGTFKNPKQWISISSIKFHWNTSSKS